LRVPSRCLVKTSPGRTISLTSSQALPFFLQSVHLPAVDEGARTQTSRGNCEISPAQRLQTRWRFSRESSTTARAFDFIWVFLRPCKVAFCSRAAASNSPSSKSDSLPSLSPSKFGSFSLRGRLAGASLATSLTDLTFRFFWTGAGTGAGAAGFLGAFFFVGLGGAAISPN